MYYSAGDKTLNHSSAHFPYHENFLRESLLLISFCAVWSCNADRSV